MSLFDKARSQKLLSFTLILFTLSVGVVIGTLITTGAKAPKPPLAKVLVATEGLPAIRLHTQGDDFLPQTHFLRRGDYFATNFCRIAPEGSAYAIHCAEEIHEERN